MQNSIKRLQGHRINNSQDHKISKVTKAEEPPPHTHKHICTHTYAHTNNLWPKHFKQETGSWILKKNYYL